MNNTVKDENGNIYHIKDKLSSGGQGCVFTVKNNESIVIKALVDEDTLDIISDETKYNNYKRKIRDVIAVGEFDYLAVPTVMLEKPLCGYIMMFMDGLQSIDKLMLPYIFKSKDKNLVRVKDLEGSSVLKTLAKTQEEFCFSYNYYGGIKKRLKCLAKLAKILAKFEDKNVVYCDLSSNNVFVSKSIDSYETWLIDLDNLSLASEVRNPIGTPKFMAPEVVNGQNNTIYSDRYSFALIAYQLLMMKEPFLGQMQDNYSSWEDDDSDDNAFETAISKGEIPWIWEVNNDENRSLGGLNPHEMLTEKLFNLFEETFNEKGRMQPHTRPSMWKWYDALLEAIESLVISYVDYSEEFKEVIHANKYGELSAPIYHLNNANPFKSSAKAKRLIVNIQDVVEVESEDEGTTMFLNKDKIIYWQVANNIDEYNLSNYDILDSRINRYIPNFISIKKIQKMFQAEASYTVNCLDQDYSSLAVYKKEKVEEISNLLDTEIYIKHKDKIIKKVTIEME